MQTQREELTTQIIRLRKQTDPCEVISSLNLTSALQKYNQPEHHKQTMYMLLIACVFIHNPQPDHGAMCIEAFTISQG